MCEDVRPERHNKVTLVGVYLRVIFFLADEQWKTKGVLHLKSLSFFCELAEVPAIVSLSWRLIDPTGQEITKPREKALVNVDPSESRPAVFVFNVTPCQFRSEGMHKLVIELDGEDLEYAFEVRVVDELPD